jgi:polysaccharide chain length determinant protein (PEP-CTERM system associated)
MTEDFDLLDEKKSPRRDPVLILKRRRWYILGPVLIFGMAASIVAEVWPLLYRSEALILVEQQKVPEQYVTPNVISSLQSRLDGMTQQILSRTRLQRMIEEFGLYPRERARVTMDQIVETMRSNITVQLVQTPGQMGGVTGFRIAYAGDSARLARQITNELTSLFIDQSLRERTEQSNSTTQFLENELDQSQKDLAIQEQRLREYKLKFVGELPEQQQGNLQILSSLEAQLYTGEGALQRAEQQKTYFEAMKNEYEALSEVKIAEDGSFVEAGARETDPAIKQIDSSLLELQRQLAVARTMYTARHPEVQDLESQVQELTRLKKQKETEWAAKVSATPQKLTRAQSATSGATRLNIVELDSRLKASELEIVNQRRNVSDLQQQIEEIRKRVNMTPLREQQLSEITRTYENSRAHYQSLLQKKLQSELASNLEKHQGGEQFRILDPASLPEKPEGRLRILGTGWLIGLCLGFGLAALREFTAQTVNDDEDVKWATDVPVFEIPVIRSPKEQRRQRQRIWLETATAILLAVAAVSASARTYWMS